MAIIPLRQYNREIEGMIDSGQIDEAIVHCRHILQSYPKYIQTYRLLGKCHLESQHYTDASDVFQRLLAVVPDDFVTHVGMSIIREDENNMDAAIWHMERAFETQPSNSAIQEELRRLYGRRDGIEPPKIRLTRGALARMYARGNLYEQAIAELRAAISEDPQRVDLMVLLAQMYNFAGQRMETIDTCNKIIKKYPFCFEANRLLAALLPETDRAADAEVYRQRLISMDPYYTGAAPNALNADDVPENTINVERLTYRPGQPVSGAPEQPAWASSLGVAFEKESSEQLPEWLQEGDAPALASAGENVPAVAAPFSWESQPETTDQTVQTPAQDETIPEWMKEAGWQPSTGEAVEGSLSFDSEDTQGEITKGEIPDWLKDMAPAGVLDEELPSLGEEDAEAALPWLQEKEPGPTDTIITWLEETKPAEAADTGSGVTDWLRSTAFPEETTPAETSAEEPAPSTPPDLADQAAALAWLESLAVQHGAKEEELITPPEERVETPPDWVRERSLFGPSEPEAPGETATAPDWLQDVAPTEEIKTPPPPEAITLEAIEEGELPDWLREMAPAEEVAPPDAVEAHPSMIESDESELPDWLRKMAATGDLTTTTLVEPGELGEAEKETEIPDWLGTTEQPEEAVSLPVENELPNWLQELESEKVPAPTAEVSIQTAKEASTSFAELETATPEPTPVSETPATAPAPEFADEDAALAWLEGLAVLHGAKEEELITKPEERLETPPDWIQEQSIPEVTLGEVVTPPAAESETPDWLQDIANEEEAPQMVSELPVEPAPGEEIPDWLKLMAVEDVISKRASEAPVEPLSGEEIPDWLKEMEPEEAIPETIAEAPAEVSPIEELPEWLKEIPTEETTITPVVEAPTEQTMEEEVPTWLQEMAVEEAAPEAVTETLVEHAAVEEVPTWLQEAAPEETVPEPLADIPVEPAAVEEIPAWMQEAVPEEAIPEAIAEVPIEPAAVEEIPAWLQETAPEEAIPEPLAEAPVVPAAVEEIPTWLQEAEPEEAVLEPLAEAPVEPAVVEEVPAWLQEMAVEESASEAITEAPAEPAMVEEIPAWLQEETPALPAEPEITIPEAAVEPIAAIPEDYEAVLADARRYMDSGQAPDAVDQYSRLVKKGIHLDTIIRELQDALYRFPVDIDIWQTLGDAYVRNDNLQEALDAYIKAEELLR
jgi:tetratricopeptide (TPR) repeat protein